MLFIDKNNNITLTRGDTAVINLTVMNEATGEPYEITDMDRVVLTVKTGTLARAVTFQKALRNGRFIIRPSDTETLEFGTYRYDVELTTPAGDVYTIIPPARFEVAEEVTTND